VEKTDPGNSKLILSG